jgi:lysophospholipid acyltransferase (LPLAT)-like uncharacterized protein
MMRVDTVPWHWKPAFHAYGFTSAVLLHAFTSLIRRTCVFERSANPAEGPRIECIWHEHLPTYIASYLPSEHGRRYAWLNHPSWYMRGVHVLLAWYGVDRLALGSSGHGGQRALERIVEYLREGYSTLVAVDGPAGPPHRVRRGALDMALATSCPIVGIRFEYERSIRGPGWDRRYVPLPGSRIRIHESASIRVERNDYERARDALTRALG